MPTTITGTDGVSQVQAGAVESGDLPAEAYQKNNILGTVSESSGVPTGAIIERGSNANGEFVKYADGTMIATGNTSVTVNTSSGFHSLRSENTRPTMPVSFASELGAIAGSIDSNPNFAITTQIKNGTASFRVFANTSLTFSTYMTIIGKWY